MSKYELKDLRDVTAQERDEIYQYAMKRSREIVSGQEFDAKAEPESDKVQSPNREPKQQS